MSGQPRRGALLVAVAATMWGLWPAWIRLAGEGGAAAAARAFLVGGLVGLPLALRAGWRRKRRPAVSWLLLAGFALSNAGNAWFYMRALAEGVVAPAVLSHYLAPVLTALAAPVVLGEPRSSRTTLALVLALAGTAVLVLAPGAAAATSDTAVRHSLLLGSASAVFFAANNLFSKRLAPDFDNAELGVFSLLGAGLILAVPMRHALVSAPVSVWMWPAIGGAISGLLAGVLFFAGVRRVPVERAAVLTYVEPVAAVVVGWLVLGEPPVAAAVGGGALVLAGGLVAALQAPAKPVASGERA